MTNDAEVSDIEKVGKRAVTPKADVDWNWQSFELSIALGQFVKETSEEK